MGDLLSDKMFTARGQTLSSKSRGRGTIEGMSDPAQCTILTLGGSDTQTGFSPHHEMALNVQQER